MRTLSDEECLRWLDSRGLSAAKYPTADAVFTAIPFEEFTSLRYTLPQDSGRKVALSRAIFRQMKVESNILVWIRNWMVWPSSSHVPLLLRLRQSLGCQRSLEEAAGHLFEASEIDDACSFQILSILFIWDCLLFEGTGRLVCFTSHDEYLVLMGPDQAFVNQVGGVLETAGWCRKGISY